MPEYREYPTEAAVQDKVYSFVGGKQPHRINFTNSEATHAVRDFHEIVDIKRAGEVPYMLGIMGGCLAHACGWSDEVIEDLEAGDNTQFFQVLARMVHAYFTGLNTGAFDAREARLS